MPYKIEREFKKFMELGAKIRELRKKQNISIDQLSEKTGLSKGLISQIERDITGPSVTSLWKICQAMNVTMNYFFDEKKGYMYTGWITTTAGNKYYFWKDGVIRSGFRKVGNKIYCFSDKGKMLKN